MGIGGERVDAIDYLTNQINRVEAAVMHQRETIQEKKPEMYGFASLAAVPYAHAAAKVLKGKKPGGMRIALAPPPTGIIWRNLTRSRASRAKSSFFGFLMLLVLFFMNIFPLIIVSLLSNMAALTSISWLGWLKSWQSSSSFTFAAVSGLGAPIIMGIASFFFPLAMRRIAKYRGVQTRYKLDRLLVGQLFGFLVVSQFLFFSLIGVVLSLVSQLVVEINHNSALAIIEKLGRNAAYATKQQYLNQSNYWLTWLPLRGYIAVFDLAQAIKLLLVWFQKVFFGRTPRDVREYTKPPVFDYWIYYANFLFMAAVAMIYAPLAPLVVIFSAVAFWMSSFIYKYQLMYVFVTKHETGGMLWRPVINRLLFCIGFMQVILILAVVLDTLNYYQAIAALPPILMLIGFKIYCRRTFDDRFDWYIPNEVEIAASKIHGGDARHNRLQRRFGHPTLNSKLFTPMVHAKVKHLLPQVYKGRLETGVAMVDGRKVETDQVAGGLKIAAIEEDQLEYDPSKDSDARSVMSGTTLGGMSMARGGVGVGTPGSMGPPRGEYFKDQYANYMAGGPMHGGEEFEMSNVAYRHPLWWQVVARGRHGCARTVQQLLCAVNSWLRGWHAPAGRLHGPIRPERAVVRASHGRPPQRAGQPDEPRLVRQHAVRQQRRCACCRVWLAGTPGGIWRRSSTHAGRGSADLSRYGDRTHAEPVPGWRLHGLAAASAAAAAIHRLATTAGVRRLPIPAHRQLCARTACASVCAVAAADAHARCRPPASASASGARPAPKRRQLLCAVARLAARIGRTTRRSVRIPAPVALSRPVHLFSTDFRFPLPLSWCCTIINSSLRCQHVLPLDNTFFILAWSSASEFLRVTSAGAVEVGLGSKCGVLRLPSTMRWTPR
jgi:hypothetical protein